MRIVMSSGHGKYIRGASGPSPWGLDEVNEARRVVDQAALELRKMGVDVTVFHDDVSDDQSENLKRIVDFHNAQGAHDFDISVHFNSATFSGSNWTANPVGHEVWYKTSNGKTISKIICDTVCSAVPFKNRGVKQTNNLAFLNNTAEVASLIEVCFVNSMGDVEIYNSRFNDICAAIASGIAGEATVPGPTPPEDSLFNALGKCSHFGGPEDTGVSPSEGLAFIFSVDEAPHLFLPYQPSGTSGLARRLNPYVNYVACRWDYGVTSKAMLKSGKRAKVTAPHNGIDMLAFPADWGPNENTGRVADLSPGLMESLGLTTDDTVEVVFPWED